MNIDCYASPFNARKKIKLESNEYSTITLAYMYVKNIDKNKKKEVYYPSRPGWRWREGPLVRGRLLPVPRLPVLPPLGRGSFH